MSNQLADEYLRATYHNLTTLSELLALKSSSRTRINRQFEICVHMLVMCVEFASEMDMRSSFANRVNEVLNNAARKGSVRESLEAWTFRSSGHRLAK